MGAFDFLAGGAGDLATGFGKSLDDPDFLSYLAGVGSKVSQGKEVGEAADISGFINKKQSDFAQKKKNVAAGTALSQALGHAGTDPEIIPKRISDVPDITPFGQAGPDETQRVETVKPDGTKSTVIKAKAAPPPVEAPQALEPAPTSELTGADASIALGGQDTVQPQSAQPAPVQAPAPVTQPPPVAEGVDLNRQVGGMPLGQFLDAQIPESAFADLTPAETGNILSGVQNMRAQKVGDIARDFEAGKISTDKIDLPEEVVVERRDAQGFPIARGVYDKPVDSKGNQAVLKGEQYYDQTTKEYEWVNAGSTPKNENSVPVSKMLSSDQVVTVNNKSAELGARILSDKNITTGEDVELDLVDKLPLMQQFNSNPLGDSVIVVSPEETIQVDTVWYNPTTWDGEKTTGVGIYLVPKMPETIEMAARNIEMASGSADKTGELTTPTPSAPKGEVEKKQPAWRHIAKGPEGRAYSMDGETWYNDAGEVL